MNISTKYSPYTISQSLARIELNKAEDLYNEMAQHFWPMIGTANQCAYLAMDAAIDAMQEAGMFRQQVKRDAQRAVEEFHKYERLCLHHFKDPKRILSRRARVYKKYLYDGLLASSGCQ